MAKQLDGVIKIGAVNCMDDWGLCNMQQIQAFPSLVMYPRKQRFDGVKSIDELAKFALSFASGNVYDLSTLDRYQAQVKKNASKPWLISYCLPSQGIDEESDDHGHELNYELNCLDESVLQKLAIMLHRLVRVGFVNCNRKEAREKLCPLLKPKVSNPIVFYSNTIPNISKESTDESYKSIEIVTSNHKLIVDAILSYLPESREINEEKLNLVLSNLRDKNKYEKPWLIQFVNNYEPGSDLELKKLPSLLQPSKFSLQKKRNLLAAILFPRWRKNESIVSEKNKLLFYKKYCLVE